MAAFDYGKTRATAERLLKRFGTGAVLRIPKTTGPSSNPVPAPPEDHPITVVILDFRSREVDGVRVRLLDKRVLISTLGLAVEPVPGHKLVLDGIEHTIPGQDQGIGVSKVAPGGVTVLYEAQARR